MGLEDLNEESFVLGLKAEELLLEPEYLDRRAYNVGLRIYHEEEEFYKNCQIIIGIITSLFVNKNKEKDVGNIREEDIMGKVTENYQNLLELVHSVSQFSHHTKRLEKRVTNAYQTLKENTKDVLS
jgi:hypothetical protein